MDHGDKSVSCWGLRDGPELVFLDLGQNCWFHVFLNDKQSSAIFDRNGVRDIGRRWLMCFDLEVLNETKRHWAAL